MDIIDTLNRVFDGAGRVLFGDDMPFPDLFGKRQKMVNEAMEREYKDLVDSQHKAINKYLSTLEQKDHKIAQLSEKLDEASRLARERFDRIREFEKAAVKSERGPVPPVAAPKTNGGRLRAMDDYALAAWLNGFQGKDFGEWMDWLGSYAD